MQLGCLQTLGSCLNLDFFQLEKITMVIFMSWPENQGILFFIIFLKHWK